MANAGIPNIEVVDPAVPGYAQRAAFLLDRDGVHVAPLTQLALPPSTTPAARPQMTTICVASTRPPQFPPTTPQISSSLNVHGRLSMPVCYAISTAWSRTSSMPSASRRLGGAVRLPFARWWEGTPRALEIVAHIGERMTDWLQRRLKIRCLLSFSNNEKQVRRTWLHVQVQFRRCHRPFRAARRVVGSLGPTCGARDHGGSIRFVRQEMVLRVGCCKSGVTACIWAIVCIFL
eukprot:SAG11_NODE_600_length_8259_cov_6.574510_3_plen_233_part_00